ncbi:cyclase-like protein 2 isoform X2 [Daucus carota subsp. sativus]|uniref:cyclase-like protein 2 isoform X2 n=1 Tax=Daucus carota subsp. sativus TaxID=79200 RepID=UPI0030833688
MRVLLTLLVYTQLLATILFSVSISLPNEAYPSPCDDDEASCFEKTQTLQPIRREIYGNGRIIDITHRLTQKTLCGHPIKLVDLLTLSSNMRNGSLYNFSVMKLPLHAGTHVDAPGHMIADYFDAGFDVDTLDLDVLNGPGLLVDVPRDSNITAEVMKSLNIPKGVRRVLFRTLNTDRGLMWKEEFDSSFVGFMKDGAQWLVDNTDIKLVGTDYLSVAAADDAIPAHVVFLEGRVEEQVLIEAKAMQNLLEALGQHQRSPDHNI